MNFDNEKVWNSPSHLSEERISQTSLLYEHLSFWEIQESKIVMLLPMIDGKGGVSA